MARFFPILSGLAVIVSAGVVHGLWTQRWQAAPELEQAAARLATLPDRLGDWQGEPAEIEADSLAQAGAVGSWVRRFNNASTGDNVTVILLCGRTGKMAVHRPETCYRGAGYELSSPAVRYTLPAQPDAAAAEFWTGKFRKETPAGTSNLRILWAWNGDGTWHAPDSPRLTFAHFTYLYKLYVVREMSFPSEPLDTDACVELVRQLLPVLDRSLSPP